MMPVMSVTRKKEFIIDGPISSKTIAFINNLQERNHKVMIIRRSAELMENGQVRVIVEYAKKE